MVSQNPLGAPDKTGVPFCEGRSMGDIKNPFEIGEILVSYSHLVGLITKLEMEMSEKINNLELETRSIKDKMKHDEAVRKIEGKTEPQYKGDIEQIKNAFILLADHLMLPLDERDWNVIWGVKKMLKEGIECHDNNVDNGNYQKLKKGVENLISIYSHPVRSVVTDTREVVRELKQLIK